MKDIHIRMAGFICLAILTQEMAQAQSPPAMRALQPPYAAARPPGTPPAQPSSQPHGAQYRPPATMAPPSVPAAQPQPAHVSPTAPAQSGNASISPQDRATATILIKNTLIAVNQGNLTGNFTVLRDLASPGFRTRNSAGDLATIFQNIRQKKVDLAPIVVLDPIIAPPRTTKEGLLVLEGYFASSPMQIKFQLGYIQGAGGGWMVDAVSVGIVPAPTTSQAPAAGTSSQPKVVDAKRPG